MIITLQKIRAISQDVRLNDNDCRCVKEFKLRSIEDICTKAIMQLNDSRNENN